ncbi:hypothetical protein [Mucisphaera sp.]|uniref:hypothetical protein n=1 Tax=Mucisphaera sp. TaxID=2913024 RepID=UPI003D112014
MARGQDTGATAVAIGAAIFAVIFGILALVFYTQLSGANQTAQSATEELNEFVSRGEQSSPEVGVYRERATRGQTVVGVMLDEIQQLRAMIGVDAALPLEDVQEQVETAGDSSLLRTLTQTRNALNRAEAQTRSKDQALTTAQEDLAESQAELARVRERFNQAATQILGQFEQLATAYTSSMQRMEGAEDRFSDLLTSLRRDKDQEIRDQQGTIQDLDQQTRNLQRRLDQVLAQLQGGGVLNQVINPDAQIVAIADENNQVFINLGNNDRLQLGLTFEVFPKGELIRTDSEGQVRGIGTIEVISIEPNTAVCRIVRLERGAVISESDSVVNVAYDQDRNVNFYVFGRYDFTDPGNPSQADRARVEGMVTRWGGTLADELTFEVDYLVLGVAPVRPAPLPPTVIDPVLIEQHAQAIAAANDYERLIAEAQALSIPILNQNRFLALVGYYER